jgi:hypothetical protein
VPKTWSTYLWKEIILLDTQCYVMKILDFIKIIKASHFLKQENDYIFFSKTNLEISLD